MDKSLNKFQELVKKRSLVCYSPLGGKDLDTTEQVNEANQG